ncbi:MAG: PASTA domain-containing protein [Gemmatimonadetes bacterium]|nr:PASTA domain-containing protein [Gemmatimonadota bacterium]
MEARRLPARSARRRRVILLGWTLASVALVVRAFQLQVLEWEEWRARAAQQQRKTLEVPAPRGAILDRDGVALALSHEIYRVAVAPRELEDAEGAAALLVDVLGLGRTEALRATRSQRPWVVLPGLHSPAVRERLVGITGFHFERALRRFYAHGDLARALLGDVDAGGAGVGGIEQEFDAVLRGRPGQEVVARDANGRPIPGESWLIREPQRGKDVVLTLDLDLQEIGHQALEEAIVATGAAGGDLLITEPWSGEILALVSLRADGRRSLSAINAPYEPGSTLKPFTVATLLAEGLAALQDSVYAEGGVWTVGTRAIRDVHPYGSLTVADALRVSSNIGIAKAAAVLPPGVHYQHLRDLGFGSPTGIGLPGESAGTLRRPRDWSAYSTSSLAIGYEIAVTPVQMVMAYGALANGGVLVEPRIVREVLDELGRPQQRLAPRVVRRALPASVAGEVSALLVDVVEAGTGKEAALATFSVAGKTGTSRYHGSGHYERGSYQASFVGFFPADAPQLVVFVKLDRPTGVYYGGMTAAPVTRATLEAALAARRAPLDRRALALAAANPPPRQRDGQRIRFASVRRAAVPEREAEAEALAAAVGEGDAAGVAVPDVAGLPVRVAVRRLHALGFRVAWPRSGPIVGTEPAAGQRVTAGAVVLLLVGDRNDG